MTKDLVKVGFKEVRGQHLVACQQLLERGESVRGDVEGADLHVLEEVVEVFGVENYLGEGLVADALPEHSAAVEGDLLVLVAAAEREHDVGRGADVLHCRGPGADLSSQHVVKYLSSIFFTLKTIV